MTQRMKSRIARDHVSMVDRVSEHAEPRLKPPFMAITDVVHDIDLVVVVNDEKPVNEAEQLDGAR